MDSPPFLLFRNNHRNGRTRRRLLKAVDDGQFVLLSSSLRGADGSVMSSMDEILSPPDSDIITEDITESQRDCERVYENVTPSQRRRN